MTTYRSNGKLLLTGEYVVLDGAKALALPTKYGQSLTVESIDNPQLLWRSIDFKGEVWFEANFPMENIASDFLNPRNDIEKRVIQILSAVKQLNPNFLNDENGFRVTTKLDFPNNWGLGSSSTLINNIANWANVDAYQLLELTFGGSGYDIACAQYNQPIVYQKKMLDNKRTVILVDFNPSFKEELFFVHLNQKQNSREGIDLYNSNKNNLAAAISEINAITDTVINCDTVSEFEILITKHEQLISNLINLPTIKSSLFPDYSRAIKSLGAWGGDFVLATGNFNEMDYFKQKGFHTIIPYHKMIL
ncbi:MAG: GHMP kinase [Flavobacteriaceae bacterium]|nr:GHMP kinase [Flavobacteriaceae bacterium]